MGTLLKPENTDLPASPRPDARSDTQPDPNHADCRGVASVLSRVGDKWSVFVIMMLGGGPKRFNELKRMINGISQRMLTLTLRGLERDGLVTRTIFPTIPPRVDYELTDLGRGLSQPVEALGRWAMEHLAQIEAARTRFDQRNDN
ncbi:MULTISPECIES: helix-turn-helix domain-containing protein [unclassified Bradyrhizobium]|uniref:winged helix-turn-helix transcriptional regulator n=1 Tax=unclassified Bradyrhizobium TaxID=2631580 RepID=UPI001FF5F133|nr:MULTISPECIES: helix-turn-helix domain-containing protein [unclassified Bradyrhizobium]MCJ9707060.1 helix-turn-helix transcriptional regulator [Bradyrhizobium sp. SHOUNA76]MCJ9736183.1 helix-turn-helix transcriptional regulator [Bradyrhizobium sp. PRIMUS42]